MRKAAPLHYMLETGAARKEAGPQVSWSTMHRLQHRSHEAPGKQLARCMIDKSSDYTVPGPLPQPCCALATVGSCQRAEGQLRLGAVHFSGGCHGGKEAEQQNDFEAAPGIILFPAIHDACEGLQLESSSTDLPDTASSRSGPAQRPRG